jgi:hypothetical protein
MYELLKLDFTILIVVEFLPDFVDGLVAHSWQELPDHADKFVFLDAAGVVFVVGFEEFVELDVTAFGHGDEFGDVLRLERGGTRLAMSSTSRKSLYSIRTLN